MADEWTLDVANDVETDGEGQSSSTEQHRNSARSQLQFAVITISDTRTIDTDSSGRILAVAMTAAGHRLSARQIVRDEPAQIVAAIKQLQSDASLDVVLMTGGTGLSPRDRTPEAVSPLFDAEIPGFGELFRMLSFQEIGPAAMLSRAMAGRIGDLLVFCLPGSTNAVRLAVEKLLVPELPHLVHHARNP